MEETQNKTACGIDALMVVCSFTPEGGKCFYPSGPCSAGKQRKELELREGVVMTCGGSSGLGAHLPSEESTRIFFKDTNAALSVAVEAICRMTTPDLDDHNERYKLFLDTLANIRAHVGEDHRLTSMSVTCAWCKRPMGTKEGNGSVGDTSTICPDCFNRQTAGVRVTSPEYDVQVVPLTTEEEQRLEVAAVSEGLQILEKRDHHAMMYAGLQA